MKQWKKRIAIMAAAGTLAVSSLTGCGSLNNDAVVATVGEQEILLGVANFYARMQQAQYESYYAALMGLTAEEMWTQELYEGATYETSVKDSTMSTLEELYLLRQHQDEFDVSLSEEEKQQIAEAAAKFEKDNSAEAVKLVSGYQKYVEEYLTLVTIGNKMDTAMREKDLDDNVSDDEAAQKAMSYVYFSFTTTDEDGTSTEMTEDEQEGLREIVEQFVEDLEADEEKDIEALAEDAGLDVQTVTFDSESTSPAAELIEAADALKKEGDITGVIETDYGFYVGKLTSLLDREATDAKKESIIEQRKQENYDSYMDAWKEENAIQVNESVWKKVKFEKQGITIAETEVDTTEE